MASSHAGHPALKRLNRSVGIHGMTSSVSALPSEARNFGQDAQKGHKGMARSRSDEERIRLYKITNCLSIKLIEIPRRAKFPTCSYCGEGNFWNVAWPTGLLLAQHFAASSERLRWQGKRVLVIGCGTGLEAVVLAQLGAVVSVLDHIPSALELVSRNCALNQIDALELICCCWRDVQKVQQLSTYDIILGSDILYDTSVVERIVLLLTIALKENGMIILGDPVRSVGSSLNAFIRTSTEAGFRMSSRWIHSRQNSMVEQVKLCTMRRSHITRNWYSKE
jgi:predicted nicotinamide N-methyase